MNKLEEIRNRWQYHAPAAWAKDDVTYLLNGQEQARARIEALEEGLRRYGWHEGQCPHNIYGECACGLSALIANLLALSNLDKEGE